MTIRHCDGGPNSGGIVTDRLPHYDTARVARQHNRTLRMDQFNRMADKVENCTCGLTFDDTEYQDLYPHAKRVKKEG